MCAERIQVIVQAEDAASGVLRSISSQFGQLGNLLEDLASPTRNWGNITASATGMVIEGMKQAVESTLAYDNSIRQLSSVSGQSAEETSRFVQVLDDYGLSADDALTATRTLTKEGYAPSIETLAKLSDQYQQLNTAEEKNEFVLKNLGRAGLGWVQALNQGGDALRAQGAAVQENLLRTEAQLQASRNLEIQWDNLKDSAAGLGISVGSELIPQLTDFLAGLNAITQGVGDFGEKIGWVLNPVGKFSEKLSDLDLLHIRNALGIERETTALQTEIPALDDNTQAQQAQAAALRAVSQENQTILSNMFALQSASEAFTNGEQERAQKLIELGAEKSHVQGELADKIAAGTARVEDYNDAESRMLDLEAQIQKLHADSAKAIDDRKEAGDRLVFNMLQQRAAADGLISSDEVKFLQDTAVNFGLVDRASADAAITAAKTADAMWAGFEKVNDPMQITADLMDTIASHDGQIVQFGVQYSSYGSLGTLGISGGTFSGGGGGAANTYRAEGGPVYAGQTYWVGERGPELFTPMQSGQIVPTGKAGVNVNITGPVTIRSTDDLDYLAQEIVSRIA